MRFSKEASLSDQDDSSIVLLRDDKNLDEACPQEMETHVVIRGSMVGYHIEKIKTEKKKKETLSSPQLYQQTRYQKP